MKYVLAILLLFSLPWMGTAMAAKASKKLDQNGRLIQQTDKNGKRLLHTYSVSGERIKSENDNGHRVFFDKSANGNAAKSTPTGAK